MSLWLPLLVLWAQNADYVEQGRTALDANKNEDAAALFARATAAEPSNYAAHFHLALADSLLGRDPEAITEYRRALELKPGLFEAEMNLGVVLLRSGQAPDAVKQLRLAVAHKPNEYRPNFYLAEALARTGDPGEAKSYYEAALKADPKRADAEIGLARALMTSGEVAAAEPHFRNAAALDPKFRDGLLELASAQEKAGNTAGAIAIYREFPDSKAAQARLGELLVENKQFAEAIPQLESAVAASPTSANRLALATAYRMSKQTDKLNEQLAAAVAGEPANYDLRMIYGRELRDQRKFPIAEQQFFEAARLKPASVEAWNELASAAIVAGDLGRGLAALDKIKSLGAESPGNLFFRAITLDKLHQNPLALESYKQFLAVSGGKFPEEEWKARQRVRIIESEMKKR